jgi:hypothetical protein
MVLVFIIISHIYSYHYDQCVVSIISFLNPFETSNYFAVKFILLDYNAP